ncbi:MAG: phosphocholine cytidylyltransferase family protein [Nannocystaceae bacterium]|nr:phosphocholine cytidylyltransferase family protein [Myxococcales bacterium]
MDIAPTIDLKKFSQRIERQGSPRRALILAAGVGRRLRPHTLTRPKCLVEVGAVPLLRQLLEALLSCGVDEWVIVTGYRGEMIKEAIARWGLRPHRVVWVENPDYEHTNTLYSVSVARRWLDRSFVLLNADLWISPGELRKLVLADVDHGMLVDTEIKLDAEAMKVALDSDGQIAAISKQLVGGVGESIGAYRFDVACGRRFLDRVAQVVADGRRQDYYEYALDELYHEGMRAALIPVRSRRWVEIDDLDDLARATACVAASHRRARLSAYDVI